MSHFIHSCACMNIEIHHSKNRKKHVSIVLFYTILQDCNQNFYSFSIHLELTNVKMIQSVSKCSSFSVCLIGLLKKLES